MSIRQPIRVLLVEDNPADIFLAQEALEIAGAFDVAVAQRLGQALRMLEVRRFEVILLDLGLPDCQGLDTLLKLRLASSDSSVIVMTGRDDEELALRAVHEGAQDYLVKSQVLDGMLARAIRYAIERQRGEAAISESKARLEALVASAMDAIVAVAADQRIVLFNAAAERMFGVSASGMLGRPLDALIPERFRHRHTDYLRAFGETGQTIRAMGRHGSICGLRANGEEFPIEASISCSQVAGDKLLTVILRDVSDRKRTEERLHEQAALAVLTAEVGLAFTKGGALREMLQACCESMVCNLPATFARIWTLHEAAAVLELQASAGMGIQFDGPHGRVPVGQFEIGHIAESKEPHLTNHVDHDIRSSDLEWATREGMVAFAGYPLQVEDRLVGVVALYARQPLTETAFQALGGVANQIALGIERKRAAAERDSLLARRQLEVERLPLAYCVFDTTFRPVDWNPAAERIFGYSKGEVLDSPIMERCVPPSAQEYVKGVLRRVLSGDMFAHSINENITKDGRTIICEWFNTPLLGEDGQISGVLSLVQDITERQRLEDQFRLAQQRLEGVVASSPAVLFTLAGEDAASLRHTWISENVYAMLGYRIEEVMQSRWWHEHVHPEDLHRLLAEIATELFTRGHLAQEYRFRHQAGIYRWVRSEMRLVRDDAGCLVDVIGSWSDITERCLLEEQLRQAQKMEAIGSLAGGVAHDFNNLLTVINGYSEIIAAQVPEDSPVKPLVREIGQAGVRAAALTRQLLAFSRKQVLEPKVLNLNTIVADTATMLKRLIGEDVELNTVLEPGLGRAKADPGQVEQILINLVVNARDAMPEGGKLTIETANTELDAANTRAYLDVRPGPYVMLTVADTGCGMDEATKARIFEPFFTTKEAGKGTGLGLATVFGIVKQSAGHIAVSSELGRGSAFKVYLPVAVETISSVRSQPGLQHSLHGTETILLTEDEPAVRALARQVLQRHGYKVLEASQGENALRLAREFQGAIHLLVTDVVMPVMGGRQLAERLVAVRPDVKVLYLSGYTDDAMVRHGVLQADTAFLQKPFSTAALAQKVREVLDR